MSHNCVLKEDTETGYGSSLQECSVTGFQNMVLRVAPWLPSDAEWTGSFLLISLGVSGPKDEHSGIL